MLFKFVFWHVTLFKVVSLCRHLRFGSILKILSEKKQKNFIEHLVRFSPVKKWLPHLTQNSFLGGLSVTNYISLFILWQVNSHACGPTVKACGSFPSHLKHSRPPSPLSSRLFTEALGNCLRYLPFFHLFNCSRQILGGRTCWYPIRGLYDSS